MEKFRNDIREFFNGNLMKIILPVLIIFSIITAITSLAFPYRSFEILNIIFSSIFVVELIAKFIAYDKDKAMHLETTHKKHSYLREYGWDLASLISLPFDIIYLYSPSIVFIANITSFLRFGRLLKFARLFNNKYEDTRWSFFKYWLKQSLEAPIYLQILYLAIPSLIIVFSFYIIFNLFGIELAGDNFWFSVITLMSDNSLYSVDNLSVWFKFLVLLLTLSGMIIFNGILIAIIVSSIMNKLEEIKKGKSRIIEHDHFIILGWNSIIPSVIKGLNAYATINSTGFFNQIISKKNVVLIMNKEIDYDNFNDMKRKNDKVKILYRSVNPYDEDNLKLQGIELSKCVIVFGNEKQYNKNSYENDLLIIKTYAMIRSILNDSPPRFIKGNDIEKPTVILNFKDTKNADYIPETLLNKHLIFSHNYFISNLLINLIEYDEHFFQYLNLFSFDEHEFVVKKDSCSTLKDKSFKNALCLFNDSIPIGLFQEDKAILLPNIEKKDMNNIILLSKNNSTNPVIVNCNICKKNNCQKFINNARAKITSKNNITIIFRFKTDIKATNITIKKDSYIYTIKEIKLLDEVKKNQFEITTEDNLPFGEKINLNILDINSDFGNSHEITIPLEHFPIVKKRIIIIGVNKNLPILVSGLLKLKKYEIILCNKNNKSDFINYCAVNFNDSIKIEDVIYIESDFNRTDEFNKINNLVLNGTKVDESIKIIILADYQFNSNITLGFSASKVDAETYFKVLKLKEHIKFKFEIVCEVFKRDSIKLITLDKIDEKHTSKLKRIESLCSDELLEKVISIISIEPRLFPVIKELVSKGGCDLVFDKTLEEIYKSYNQQLPSNYFDEKKSFNGILTDCYHDLGVLLIGVNKKKNNNDETRNDELYIFNPSRKEDINDENYSVNSLTKFVFIETSLNEVLIDDPTKKSTQ